MAETAENGWNSWKWLKVLKIANFQHNSTCRSLKLILKRSALSPLSAHPQPTLSPPLSHPHPISYDKPKAENGWNSWKWLKVLKIANFRHNLTCRSLKLILKRSALSPLSSHHQPTLSPPLSHPQVTLTLFPMISRKLKMAETAENGWKCWKVG